MTDASSPLQILRKARVTGAIWLALPQVRRAVSKERDVA